MIHDVDIKRYLKEHGPSYASEIAEHFGLNSSSSIIRNLSGMRSRGEIIGQIPQTKKDRRYRQTLRWRLP